MSNAYNIFTGNALDPRDSVYTVYTVIAGALRKATETMSEETKALYLKENPNRHNMGWRNSLQFDQDDITEITAKDNTITIELGRNQPCGRGCCSDWISDSMTIPDHLISAYEATQVGVYADEFFEDEDAAVVFDAAITFHAKSIVDGIDERIAAEKSEKARKAELARIAAAQRREQEAIEKEANDRAEFERLSKKFKEQA